VALTRAFTGTLVPASTDAELATTLLRSSDKPNLRGRRGGFEATSDSAAMPKRHPSKRRSRRAITDVLAAAGEEMRPEHLLDESGIGEDLIDEFFAELKRELAVGRIAERRDGDGNPFIALDGGAA
jgi:hypothetical protein